MRRRAEPELGPMPATLAALPLPSLPTGGGWTRTGSLSCLSPWWPTKGQSPQQPAWAAPAAPVRPITDQRPEPTRARAALKRLALASAWLPYTRAGCRAGPARSRAALEVVDLWARWAVRCGADGWLATGGPRPAKAKLLRRRLLAIPAAVGAWDETANRPPTATFAKAPLVVSGFQLPPALSGCLSIAFEG